MASSRHAGHAGPCLSGRRTPARHQGERTSPSRQTCCLSLFPRCAGSSGASSGQGRPIPVASSLGRTGDDDTSSAPDDHTGPTAPELINPGCSTRVKLSCCGTFIRADRDEAVLVVVGRMGERAEWSIGEALLDVNYHVPEPEAAYVYAMAEKRAKDRVILKLIGLQDVVPSEEAHEVESP